MSLLLDNFNIIIDQGVCMVGHGKSIVDAINCVDKNIIIRAIVQKIKQVADVILVIQVLSLNLDRD